MLWAYEHANRNSIHYVFYGCYFIVFHFLVGMMLASLATGIILESYVVTRGLEREEEVRHENEALGNEADDLRESWHDHSRRLEEHMYRGDLAEVEAEEMRALGSLTEELGMQDMNELQAVRQRHASIAALHTQHSIWYKLTVKTADMRGAGTQASVSVRLRGHAHHSELHHLHHSHGERAFGRGATDTFLVASPHDLGELAEIHVEMDGAGKTSAWLLDSISVQRPGADGWWFFPYGQWLGKEDSVHSGRSSTSSRPSVTIAAQMHHGSRNHEYVVEIKTGELPNRPCGTDSNVFITLRGEHGASPRVRLDNAEDNFQTGMFDSFVVEAPLLGEIQEVVLQCDGAGLGNPTWFCDHVVVEEPNMQKRWGFQFTSWFDGKGDATAWTQSRSPEADVWSAPSLHASGRENSERAGLSSQSL